MAEFYLKAEGGVEDLFAERRGNAGVLFASIPNFTEFYSEDVNEVNPWQDLKRGLASLRMRNPNSLPN